MRNISQILAIGLMFSTSLLGKPEYQAPVFSNEPALQFRTSNPKKKSRKSHLKRINKKRGK